MLSVTHFALLESQRGFTMFKPMKYSTIVSIKSQENKKIREMGVVLFL
jgi:hypothetical protein